MSWLQAAIIEVTDGAIAVTNDSTCSLIEAFENANDTDNSQHADCTFGNTNPNETDTIILPSNAIFTITSPAGPADTATPNIAQPLIIEGNNSIIERNSADEFRILTVLQDVTVEFNNLTVQGGKTTNGGGIFSKGNLTLNDVTVQNNIATNNGGGITNQGGTLTLHYTTVRNNQSQGSSASAGGGGIYASSSTTTDINNSSINNNQSSRRGGGIYNGGTLNVNRSTLSVNNSFSRGGGIYSEFGMLTVIRSTFNGNMSTANHGGGIYSNATTTINHSTFNGNTASRDGGSLYNDDSTFIVTRSTLSGNTADRNGGGIYVYLGTTTFIHNILDNSNGNCSGTTPATTNSLISDASCGTGSTNVIDSADLGPLQDNGGPTFTQLPNNTSPAIDRYDCTGDSDDTRLDQRGVEPIDVTGINNGGICDWGAAENDLPPPPAITTQPSDATVCDGQPATFSVAADNATDYQWQVSTDNGSSYSTITDNATFSGATTTTLTVNAIEDANGYLFRAVVSNASSSTTSNAATLTVNTGEPRFSAIDPDNSLITITNTGSCPIDLNNWQLCSGFSYVTITSSLVVAGSLTPAPNASVTLSWAGIRSGNDRDLGLYVPGGSFGSPAAMEDFTQWGAAGNGRESVAVAKGIWAAGDFMPGVAPYSRTNPSAFGLSAWATTPVLSISDASVTEGDSGTTTLNFTVSLSSAHSQDVNFTYTTADDSAIAPSDYTAVTTGGTGTITTGQTQTTVSITVNGDTDIEPDETLTLTATPSAGAPTTGTGTITNDDVPNNPPIAADDNATVDEDNSINIDVINNDSDPDSDPLMLDSVNSPTANDGSAAINTGTTPHSIDYTPAANFNGTDTFDYQISDGNGGTDTATITVTVNSVNDAPEYDGTLVNQTVPDGYMGYSYNVSAAFSDPNDNPPNTLTYTISGQPLGLIIDNSSGVISGDITDAAGDYFIDITATDDGTPSESTIGSFILSVLVDDGSVGIIPVTDNTVAINDEPGVYGDAGVVCSLLEAFENANNPNSSTQHDDCVQGYTAANATDIIVLPDNTTFTITSAAGPADTATPNIAQFLTIEGNHSIIERNSADEFRILTVLQGIKAEFNNLTVQGGKTGNGGGIFSKGDLTLNNVTVQDNTATNSGGGITNQGGTLTLHDTTLRNNQSQSSSFNAGGGGIFASSSATTAINNSSISNNQASNGGGLYTGGTLTVTRSTLSGNTAANLQGGGIYNSGMLTVNRSTLSGNMANINGGGIYNSDMLTVTRSTFSGNTATFDGGGIFNNDTLTVTRSTLSGNTANNGNGIYQGSGTATVNHNILDNLDDNGNGDNCFNFTGATNSLISDDTCGINLSSVTNTPANLGPLQDNGGATLTMLPNSTSQAIDRYRCTSDPDDTRLDQRDIEPINVHGIPNEICDWGAAEHDPRTPPTVSIADATGLEANGVITFELNLDNAVDYDVNVTLSTADSSSVSATADVDYTALTDHLVTIPAGDTTATVDVTIIDDALSEPDETFTLAIQDPNNTGNYGGATINTTNNSATGTIIESVPPVFTSASTLSANEDATTNFTVTASDASSADEDLTITLSNRDGAGPWLTFVSDATATDHSGSGTDRNTNSGTLTATNPDDADIRTYNLQFTIGDGPNSITQIVMFTVNPVNDAPVATNDSITTSEDTFASCNVITGINGCTSDSDVDSPAASLTVSQVNGTAGNVGTSITLTASGTNFATVTLSSAGVLNITPIANQSGSAILTYVINDGSVDSNTAATITVTVNPANDAPVAINDNITTPEDTFASCNVITGTNGCTADGDIDSPAASLTVAQVNGTASNVGTSITLTGSDSAFATVTLSSTGALNVTPIANQSGSATLTYVINDGSANSNIATITVIVTPVNDAPVFDPNTSADSTNEEAAITINLPISDDDAGDTHTYTTGSNPANGSAVFDNANNTVTYTPNTDFVGADQFTVIATDSSGASNVDSNPLTITITVNNVNDAPEYDGSLVDQTAFEQQIGFSYDTSTAFSDVDSNNPTPDTLAYSTSSTLPTGLTLDSATGILSGDIDANAASGSDAGDGIYVIDIIAADTGTETATGSFTLTVAPLNVDLEVALELTSAAASIDNTQTLSVTIDNTGDDSADDVELQLDVYGDVMPSTDSLDCNVVIITDASIAGDAQRYTCTFAQVAVNDPQTLTIILNGNADTAISVVAVVTATQGDVDDSNNTATIQGSRHVQLTNSDDENGSAEILSGDCSATSLSGNYDIDGDGDADLVTATVNNTTPASATIHLYRNQGFGLFNGTITTRTVSLSLLNPCQLYLVNNNGVPAIVIPHSEGVTLLPLNTDGSFSNQPPTALINSDNTVIDAIISDFNNDEQPDIALLTDADTADLDNTTNVNVYLNTGGNFNNGSFPTIPLSSPAGTATALAAGDVNNDSNVDIVPSSSTSSPSGNANNLPLVILAGDGSGNFIDTTLTIDTPLAPDYNQANNINLVDIDNDGDLDIVATLVDTDASDNDGSSNTNGNTSQQPTTTITIVLDNGNATVSEPLLGGDAGSTSVTTTDTQGNTTTTILLSESGTITTALNDLNLNDTPTNATLIDLNGDGVLDIIATTVSGATYTFIADTEAGRYGALKIALGVSSGSNGGGGAWGWGIFGLWVLLSIAIKRRNYTNV